MCRVLQLKLKCMPTVTGGEIVERGVRHPKVINYLEAAVYTDNSLC